MKTGYALLKACMEDQPNQVNQIFNRALAERIANSYKGIEKAVGRAIGRGESIDYDQIINEAGDYALPDEVEPTVQDNEDEEGLDGTAPLGGSTEANRNTVATPLIGQGVY